MNQQVMDFSFSDLNYNSVVIDTVAMLSSIETLSGFEEQMVKNAELKKFGGISRDIPPSDSLFFLSVYPQWK